MFARSKLFNLELPGFVLPESQDDGWPQMDDARSWTPLYVWRENRRLEYERFLVQSSEQYAVRCCSSEAYLLGVDVS